MRGPRFPDRRPESSVPPVRNRATQGFLSAVILYVTVMGDVLCAAIERITACNFQSTYTFLATAGGTLCIVSVQDSLQCMVP